MVTNGGQSEEQADQSLQERLDAKSSKVCEIGRSLQFCKSSTYLLKAIIKK